MQRTKQTDWKMVLPGYSLSAEVLLLEGDMEDIKDKIGNLQQWNQTIHVHCKFQFLMYMRQNKILIQTSR
jgi:hypothetical protein